MKKLSERNIYERQISEEDVFRACRQLLELNGAKVHRVVERIPWGRRKSEPGLPDSFGWWPKGSDLSWAEDVGSGRRVTHLWIRPVHFYIEFKRPGGVRRPSQILWIDEARRDGVIAFFADSVEAMVRGFLEHGIRLRGAEGLLDLRRPSVG